MRFHPVSEIFPLMSGEEYQAFKADIAVNGLREPITTWQEQIIDGRNRYNACMELGIESRYVEWDGQGSLLAYIISKNLHRRHLSESQRAMVAAQIANMPLGGAIYRSANLPTDMGLVSQEEAAKLLNISERTIRNARQVIEEGAPELIEATKTGKVTVSAAARAVKKPKQKQRQLIDMVEAGEAKSLTDALRKQKKADCQESPLPEGKYRVFYADPPWKYNDAGIMIPITDQENYGKAETYYPAMETEEICAKPIKDMADDDAVLFLWVTSPMLEEAFKVISAWGFKYKTSFVWDKVRHNFGHYNSVRHEFLLVCTRGSCTPDSDEKVDSVQSIERSEEHSEKPEQFRAIIDRLYTWGRRIELFARKQAPNWEAWGNE